MQKQINGSISNCFSPYICGYWKVYNTQRTLLALAEKWEKNFDDEDYGGAVLIDLSQAFDALDQNFLEQDALKLFLKLPHKQLGWISTRMN